MSRVTKVDPNWEKVQHRTFTAWANTHLKKLDPPVQIEDLLTGVKTGENLIRLVETLTQKKVVVAPKKNPTMRIHMIQNNKIAIDHIEKEGLKLVGVGAEDMVDGVLKIILGLMWTIILRYQINKKKQKKPKEVPPAVVQPQPVVEAVAPSVTTTAAVQPQAVPVILEKPAEVAKPVSVPVVTPTVVPTKKKDEDDSDANAQKELLEWVKNQVSPFGVEVGDFMKSWQSGVALSALVHSLKKPALDFANIDRSNPLKLNRDAIEIAERELGIPTIIDPEDVTDKPEKLSMMTYISYFRDYAFDHEDELYTAEPEPEIIEPSAPVVDGEHCKIEEFPTEFFQGVPVEFFIDAFDANDLAIEAEPENFMVAFSGPDEACTAKIVCKDGDKKRFCAQFTPKLPGKYKMFVTANGAGLKQCPIAFEVLPGADATKTTLEGIESFKNLKIKPKTPVNFSIKQRDSQGKPLVKPSPIQAIRVKVINKDNEEDEVPVEISVDEKDLAQSNVSFVPQEGGDYDVEVSIEDIDGNESVVGGKPAFTVAVQHEISPEKTQVFGKGVKQTADDDSDILTVGEPTKFTIESCDRKGNRFPEGGQPFSVEIASSDASAPAIAPKITDKGDGTYEVEYTPSSEGPFQVSVKFNNVPVSDSPFNGIRAQRKTSPPNCIAFGPGLESRVPVKVGTPHTFTVQMRDQFGENVNEGGQQVKVDAIPEDGPKASVTVEDNGDGTHTVTYVPECGGEHNIKIIVNDEPVLAGPYRFTALPQVYAPKCTISGKGASKATTGIPASFQIKSYDKHGKYVPVGGNRFTVVLEDEDQTPVPTALVDHGTGLYTVKYVPPAIPGNYKCQVSLDDLPVGNTPFVITVDPAISPAQSFADGPGVEEVNASHMHPVAFVIHARDYLNKPVLPKQAQPGMNRKVQLAIARDLEVALPPLTAGTSKPHRATTFATDDDDVLPTASDDFSEESYSQNTYEEPVEVEESLPDFPPVYYYYDKATKLAEEDQTTQNPLYNNIDESALAEAAKHVPFDVEVAGSDGTSISNKPNVYHIGNGDYAVVYQPKKLGDALVSVTLKPDLDDPQAQPQPIRGSPYNVHIHDGLDPQYTTVTGPGLLKACVGAPARVTIHPRDRNNRLITVGGDDFNVIVKDPAGKQSAKLVAVEDTGRGTYNVFFKPKVPGNHTVNIKYKGKALKGCPFTVFAREIEERPDPAKCEVYNMKDKAKVAKPSLFNVRLKNKKGEPIACGSDNVIVKVTGPDGEEVPGGAPEEIEVNDHGNGKYTVNYTPQKPGEQHVHVSVNGDPIGNSPFRLITVSSVSSRYSQVGDWSFAVRVPVDKPVNVNAFDMHLTELTADNKVPPKLIVLPNVKKMAPNKVNVVYDPTPLGALHEQRKAAQAGRETGEPLTYKVDVLYYKKHVQGSPFTQVFDTSAK